MIAMFKRLGDIEGVFASIWLLFLGFPLLAIWSGDHSFARTAAATVAILAFAATYVRGFVQVSKLEAASLRPQDWKWGWNYLAGLVACVAIAYAFTDIAVLGALPFVASFAVFTRSWTEAIVIFFMLLAVAIGGPAAVDNLALGLLFGALVGCIGLATLVLRADEERQALATSLQMDLAVAQERERVARDVHDVVGHNLTATILKAELAQALLEGIEATSEEGNVRLQRGRAELADLETVSRRSLAEIRATVSGMRVADLDDELHSARSVLADAGVTLLIEGDRQKISGPRRQAVAWTIREGVTNVVRHARASMCRISLAPSDDVWLVLSDDGQGLAASGNAENGNGLAGLRSRLAEADLRLEITSAGDRTSSTGPGTTLTVRGSST